MKNAMAISHGWAGLIWNLFFSSVLSHHTTFLVNYAYHLRGAQPYAIADASRNTWIVALLTLGEG